MLPDKYGKMVDLLYEKTMADELRWEKSPYDDRFQVSFRKYSITIYLVQTGSRLIIKITIVNEEGREIDDFSNEHILPESIGYKDPFEVMSDMYEKARRQANGVDEAIDDILGDLEK